MTNPQLFEQTEWFHQFARQPVDELALQANNANRALFVKASLSNYTPQEDLSPKEFANAVIELRKNESHWNHALMAVLIKADDLYNSQELQGAISELESFANSCPWKLFEEVARDQVSTLKPC